MIEKEKIEFLFPKSSKIIVAVSGGADSVALLDILHTSGFPCVVVHCNFHLRGEESCRDEAFVKQLAEQYRLPFRKIDFQTEQYAAEQMISIEMAARDLRYAWFHTLLQEENADAVAVAHHSDDVVETLLINMVRGTGVRGLTGMKELNGKIWRPLLAYTREEVLAYISRRNLKYVVDSTNNESLYTRNKFRNEIIPQIERSFPTFKSSILRLASNLKSTEAYLNHHLEEDKKALLQKVGEACYQVDLSKLLAWGESLPYLLHELFSPFGFNPATLEDLFRTLSENKSGRIFYSKDRRYTLVKNTESVELFPTAAAAEEEFQIQSIEELPNLPIPLTAEKKDRVAVQFQRDAQICYIDEAKLKFPLTMRHWREGDRFSPLGMAGKMKKVSDFFIDKKIREHEKRQIWILTSGAGDSEAVVWIVGYRSDERFKVDEKTEKVLVLTRRP